MSQLPSTCCMRGSIHAGSTTGTEQVVHGLQTYVASPADPSSPVKGTVVIIADAFGWDFINLRLLADSYARRGGFRVLLPDFHSGKSLSKDHLDLAFPMPGRTPTNSIALVTGIPQFLYWLWSHRQSVSLPIITTFFASLHAEQSRIAARTGVAGFCWGGRYAVLMHDHVDAIYAAHPSFLQVPADVAAISKPVSFALGEKDTVLPMPQIEKLKGVLSKKKDSLESEVIVYEGMPHSFAVRGNPEIEEAKKGLEDSETQAVEWFTKHLHAE
ncbi:hypothetical protein DRE_04084 [Drechslerella stenobrocha 248]|uniref:Dienelactone hydrolase domain-containing protein n=1 Tax=Drechslerella stenobrocha 248 TaxID=1043628 RepID=W7I2I8_9PEZI|nr:hypothetical protein DRE_04084 [Drechslerella stenobrocha 248]